MLQKRSGPVCGYQFGLILWFSCCRHVTKVACDMGRLNSDDGDFNSEYYFKRSGRLSGIDHYRLKLETYSHNSKCLGYINRSLTNTDGILK